MADSARPIYRPIPPPPLPEFYLKTPASKLPSTSTSTSDDDPQRLPPAPGYGDTTRPTYRYYAYTSAAELQPTPAMEPADDMQPLPDRHMCRICLRRRSARYHREHAIPVDGVPPPPGICRRCRISSVPGSTTTAEVIEVKDSSEVKLGIKCLIPGDEYVSADALRARATERFVEDRDYMELEPASDRGIDAIYRPARASAPQERVLNYAYRPAQMMVPPPPPRTAPRTVTLASGEQTRLTMASNAATMGQDSSERVESSTIAPMPTRAASPTRLKRSDSVQEVTERRKSSRSRHSHHTSIVIEPYKPERTEIEIRRLARDEVERYRQAERLMEAHGDVYSYGKLVAMEATPSEPKPVARVPLERRIALEKDVVDRPWIKSPERPRSLEFATVHRREKTETGREQVLEEGATRGRSTTSVIDREPSQAQTSYASRRERTRIEREPAGNSTHRDDISKHRRAKVAENPARYEAMEAEEAAQQYKDSAADKRFKNAEQRSAKFAESMREDQDARDGSGAQQADVVSSSSGWTDQEYWLDGQPAQAKVERSSKDAKARDEEPQTGRRGERLVHQRQPMAAEPIPRERVTASSSRRMRNSFSERTATKYLPYPAEESIVSAQMPSPKPPISKAKASKPPDDDEEEGEYAFVKRTVQHTRSSSRPGREKPYYEVYEAFGRRSKPAQPQTKPQEEVDANVRRKDVDQRASDVSSRVRFSKQVEFSPTPPGSDASSTQFRKLGRMRRDLGVAETGGDLIAEYERRGRARSRLHYDGHDYR